MIARLLALAGLELADHFDRLADDVDELVTGEPPLASLPARALQVAAHLRTAALQIRAISIAEMLRRAS